MAKPSILTRLVKGKAIGAFPDFVATWNYIVDFIENLRGDGDDDKAKGILLDRTVEDRPVIRLSDDYQPGGGGASPDGVSIVDNEPGYDGKHAVKGHSSADANKVFSKVAGASAGDPSVPGWQFPITAQGISGSALRGYGVKIAKDSLTNLSCSASVDANGVVTLTFGVRYV